MSCNLQAVTRYLGYLLGRAGVLLNFLLLKTHKVEGNEGFPPPLEKDLDSPSSKCLEALVPSLD